MAMNAQVLIADDDQVSSQLFAEVLAGEGYQVRQVRSGADALTALERERPDLLIVDVRMPGVNGLDVTRQAHRDHPELPVVVMTAFGSMDTAIQAIREGAYDFISKPMNLEELKRVVRRALAQPELRQPKSWESGRVDDGAFLGSVVGKSQPMMEVYKTIARAAPTRSTVLILGESGTGKELIARAIHEHSERAGHPFVAVDCGALTETLLASELFGHVRGAFTGAVSDKKGVFESAQGGTCFLDEIGNISLENQAKLLRTLQEHEVRPVGSQKPIKVDVRIVAATNKDLESLIRSGAFREDLYYRVKVVTIHLPPLRERTEDIAPLAEYFRKRYSHESAKPVTAISEPTMSLLLKYWWPGNVRELENVIERAVVLSNQRAITVEDLPAEIRTLSRPSLYGNESGREPLLIADTPPLEEVKKRYVLRVIALCDGNLSRAARMLNIDRRSLYRMLTRYKAGAGVKN
ncbi:MAG: sigma-54-dependent transcriptional regulator [Chloroflexota bacterium]